MRLRLFILLIITCTGIALKAQAPVDTLKTKVSDSVQHKIDEYKKLLDAGVISDEEFEKKKADLLGKPVINNNNSEPANGGGTTNTNTNNDNKKQVPAAGPRFDEPLTKADTMPLNLLRDRYKGRIVAGSVILSVGGAFLVGDLLMGTLSKPINKTDTLYDQKVATRRGSEIALGVIGGLAGVGGAVFLALGLKDKAIYKRRGKELSLKYTGRELGLALKF